jgi:hypothetical protein
MEKEELADGIAFIFRHRRLGILGQVRIQERAAGGSYLVTEVVGDPADPMTKKRAALFEPLARDICALLTTDAAASDRREAAPSPPEDPRQRVYGEQIVCPECGKAVAMVTTALDAKDADQLENTARRLYAEHPDVNLPAWIVGPLRTESGTNRAVLDVLPAWPVHGPIVTQIGDEFDAMIDLLSERHCHTH